MDRNDQTWETIVKVFIVIGILFVGFILTQGCTTTPSTETVPPAVSVPPPGITPGPALYKADWPNQGWTIYLNDALDDLGKPLLAFNPPAKCTSTKKYWMGLIVALSKFESNWNPNTVYTESFRDSKGALVESIGLLQMSPGDHGIYGCEAATKEDFKDPQMNLRCGVRAMAKLVARDGVIWGYMGHWTSLARYWSPFRNDVKRNVILEKAAKACE